MAKQTLGFYSANPLTVSEERIAKLCEDLGFSVQFGNDIVCINSGFSRWLLIMNDEYTVKEALHENHRFNVLGSTGNRKTHSGYHKQKLYSKNIPKVLEYIKAHDRANLKLGKSVFDVFKAS